MARMICVNTFALNGNLTVTYKTLIFSNLYFYEFCENFANFIRWHANAGCGYQTKCKSDTQIRCRTIG